MPINPDSHQPQRHEFGGPPCWDASFDQIDWAENDHWTYHAIADVVLANSLLRSFPEVDPKRIGISGISWGGYLTSIAASVDPRFRFAVPVYGCGFLGENSLWVPTLQKLGPEKEKKWLQLWDPSVYLSRAKMPFFWITGTNDIGYPLDSFQKTYRLPQGPRTLSVHLRMPHSHEDGWKPEEILAFANQFMNSGTPLTRVLSQARDQQRAWIKFKSKSPVVRAELLYTLDNGIWKDRRWLAIPAQITPGKAMVQATLPKGVRVFFFNLTDARGLVVSSEHQVL
jgi:PhoPQ-activated pathogenicity-related protein